MSATPGSLIRAIEEASINAWPSLETALYDGWLLRAANGFTRRANSVQPLDVSTLELETKVRYCEVWYAARNQPAIFKLTSAAQPPDLDAFLEARGYLRQAETLVQLRLLDGSTLRTTGNPLRASPLPSGENCHCEDASDGGASNRGNPLRGRVTPRRSRSFAPSSPPSDAPTLHISPQATAAWVAEYLAMNGHDPRHLDTALKMMAAIRTPCAYLSLCPAGSKEVIAVGLGVADREYLGLFDIVVHPNHRGRGLGTRVVDELLHWGRQQGAQLAYLQVMADNLPALRLYDRLGFTEAYGYWYRVAPPLP